MKLHPTRLPTHVDWQITYACQLRCTHCYTESGRRASRKLARADLLRIADTIVAMQVKRVLIGGGEPLLVPEVFEIVERLRCADIAISLYTNGFELTEEQAATMARLDAQVHVSVDGSTQEINDPIRGREGAFDAAVRSLQLLNAAALERKRAGAPRFRFGIDVTLVQSNYGDIEAICTKLAPRFSELTFLQLGGVIPSGLAAEEAFAEHEVLDDEQLAQLADPAFARALTQLAPPTLEYVCVSDNVSLQLHSERARGMQMPYAEVMEIEPDGSVRAMVTYEGVVGNILHDPPEQVWQRCQERVNHPHVVAELQGVKTPRDWAAAVRRLDQFFGTEQDLVRFGRRVPYSPAVGSAP